MQHITGMGLLGVTRPRRMSVAEALAISGTSTAGRRDARPANRRRGASQLTRDADGAIWITEARARKGSLPAGRYRYHTAGGGTSTVEVGQSACAEGFKMRLIDAAKRTAKRERAVQSNEFGGI